MAQSDETMTLTVNIPDRVLFSGQGIVRLVAESVVGSFGILPHRLDVVSPIITSILVYEGQDGVERYFALDEGVLIKAGLDVSISVRSAIMGDDLSHLRDQIEHEIRSLSDSEQHVRAILSKIEDDFIRLYHEVQYA